MTNNSKITKQEIKRLEKTSPALAKAAKVNSITSALCQLCFNDKQIWADYELQDKLEHIYDELHAITTDLLYEANEIERNK